MDTNWKNLSELYLQKKICLMLLTKLITSKDKIHLEFMFITINKVISNSFFRQKKKS